MTQSQHATPPPATATRLQAFGTTVFAEISRRALAAQAVNLGQGFPDFEGPDFVKDAAERALRDHPNQYAPLAGLPVLTKAIADRWREDAKATIDPANEVTVTAGCTEAIAATILGLVNPGEKVVVFEPFYDSYVACIAMAGAEMIAVALRPDAEGRFGFDADELARAMATPGVRAVLVNTPHNPTGKVFSAPELQSIAELCKKHDVIAITDEVYDRLVYRDTHNPDAKHIRMATLPDMAQRTVTLNSLGKTFSLTGWKIGWAIAPPHLSAGVRAAHQFLTFAVATPLQRAAAAALGVDDSYYAQLAETFRAQRDLLAEALEGLGFRFARPAGGYFILADHTQVSQRLGLADDLAMCNHLIEKVGVATIPPSVFYVRKELGRPLLRFAFCKTEQTLRAAVERLGGLKTGQ
ncbi:MAG: aminotransferase class I/II-fold pyridoxal phosphate-dependent enzyme [Phycisphaerales bacterium]|nr:aminotransferase class I/II-fold pyridoxal phosphate-dependent enzyme [Phycisphaerales bacterium]